MATVWQYDIENRFPAYTVTLSTLGSLKVCEVKEGATIIVRAQTLDEEQSVLNCRRSLGIRENVLPCLSAAQLALVTLESGQLVTGLDADNLLIGSTNSGAVPPDLADDNGIYTIDGDIEQLVSGDAQPVATEGQIRTGSDWKIRGRDTIGGEIDVLKWAGNYTELSGFNGVNLKYRSNTLIKVDAFGVIALTSMQARVFTLQYSESVTTGATPAINWSLYGSYLLNLSEDASPVFTVTNQNTGAVGLTLRVVQDSTPRTITWPSNVRWDNGGVVPTLSAGSGAIDVFEFYLNGDSGIFHGRIYGQNYPA